MAGSREIDLTETTRRTRNDKKLEPCTADQTKDFSPPSQQDPNSFSTAEGSEEPMFCLGSGKLREAKRKKMLEDDDDDDIGRIMRPAKREKEVQESGNFGDKDKGNGILDSKEDLEEIAIKMLLAMAMRKRTLSSSSEEEQIAGYRERRGNGQLAQEDGLVSDADGDTKVESGSESEVENGSGGDVVSDEEQDRQRPLSESERRIRIWNAASYAHPIEGRDKLQTEVDEKPDTENWPASFTTALKIINKDKEKGKWQACGSSTGERRPADVDWFPNNVKDRRHRKNVVPSLQELSSRCLANYADYLVSLDYVPDHLRRRLSQLLCDSRRMNGHFLKLLVRGSPTEICLTDCTSLTEESFKNAFQNFDPSELRVLQLAFCGRCLPVYALCPTLARSANSLPALTTLSVRGDFRLSNDGLYPLVSSAPALSSLDLAWCSLLTSSSIHTLANSSCSKLRELYLDRCLSIDVMHMLPGLKKLEQLEVLSLAGIESVSDEFIGEFISIRGHNVKELILADCVNLTDSSLKIISKKCPGLCAIDLWNLCKLTDSSLGYLANCQEIQRLKLHRNSFSDAAIAAFLYSSGEYLEELVLTNVRKVGCCTATSIARHSRMLRTLDLSFCRDVTDNALGLIVDSCQLLRLLKLFGCTQITDVFVNGHSNPGVKIIGLPMFPVLEDS